MADSRDVRGMREAQTDAVAPVLSVPDRRTNPERPQPVQGMWLLLTYDEVKALWRGEVPESVQQECRAMLTR